MSSAAPRCGPFEKFVSANEPAALDQLAARGFTPDECRAAICASQLPTDGLAIFQAWGLNLTNQRGQQAIDALHSLKLVVSGPVDGKTGKSTDTHDEDHF